MCPLRIAALEQPMLPFSDVAVPETIVWLALPDEVRSRALMLLAGLIARQGLGELSPGGDDAEASAASEGPATREQEQGGCR